MRRRRKDITEEERKITDRKTANLRTLRRAVKLLAAKPRSVGELRERLLEKKWTDAEIVDDVIARLTGYGYLNDAQFAKDFAALKLREKPFGKRRLRHTLENKKLSRTDIDNALEAAYQIRPEADLVKTALERKIRRSGLPKNRDEMKKIFDYLARLGFDYELIRASLREIDSPASDFPED